MPHGLQQSCHLCQHWLHRPVNCRCARVHRCCRPATPSLVPLVSLLPSLVVRFPVTQQQLEGCCRAKRCQAVNGRRRGAHTACGQRPQYGRLARGVGRGEAGGSRERERGHKSSARNGGGGAAAAGTEGKADSTCLPKPLTAPAPAARAERAGNQNYSYRKAGWHTVAVAAAMAAVVWPQERSKGDPSHGPGLHTFCCPLRSSLLLLFLLLLFRLLLRCRRRLLLSRLRLPLPAGL